MKKFILFITVATTIYGQSMFRIVGGPNISNFINDSDSDFLTGYSIGLMYEQSFSKNWSFETGILYSKMGGRLNNKIWRIINYEEGAISGADLDTSFYKINIHAMAGFIKLPAYVNYKFYQLGKESVLSISSGFSFLLAINDNTYDYYSPNSEITDGKTNMDYDYDHIGGEAVFKGHWNVSFDLGIKYSYQHLFLSLGSQFQLREFGQYFYFSTIKNRSYTLEFLIGYTF